MVLSTVTLVPVLLIASCLTFISTASLGNILSPAAKLKRQRVLPPDQLREMREKFSSMFDKNGDGSISHTEIQAALVAQGQPQPMDMIERVVSEADVDWDGAIDFSEFLAMHGFAVPGNNIPLSSLTNERHRAEFNLFDENEDGYVTATEMKTVMVEMGNDLSEAEVLTIYTPADLNGDGKMSLEEFKLSMIVN